MCIDGSTTELVVALALVVLAGWIFWVMAGR